MRLLLLVPMLLLVACTQSIADVKQPEKVGQKVTVAGNVKMSIKIGSLSGFALEDETGSINVRSDTLPVEGRRAVVSGTLIKDSLFGYYIQAESVR